MKHWPEIFTQPFQHWNKLMFFKKMLYIFLILNTLSLLPIANEIFGYNGIVGSTGWYTGTPWYLQGSRGLINILSHPYNISRPWISYVFIIGQLVALGFGLFNRFPKLAAVLVYFFTVNLFNKGYLMFTGGEILINLMLFYLIFIQRSDKNRDDNPEFSEVQNVLNNTFYWIILIQVCVLYFFSNFFKLLDPIWRNGEALMYVSRIDAYSSASMRFLFADNPVISMVGTYIVLLYQGLFPILVWFKRIKIPFLTVGVILHLGIAFGMGIFTFGIIMILVYIPFLSDSQIRTIQNRFRKKTIAD
ncbi:hypothetical protein N8987_04980 [Crocinitomix sp.]|nr:hypothetical protein [Crocinitomix sp.]